MDEEETAALLNSAQRSAWKEKAIELLSRKPQSRKELERRLREWEAGEEEIAAICDRMEELGYLNDAAYAEQVVRRYSARGFGEKKLRDELYRRGIPRELWDEALNQAEDPARRHRRFCGKEAGGKDPRPEGTEKGVRRSGPPGLLLERYFRRAAPLWRAVRRITNNR